MALFDIVKCEWDQLVLDTFPAQAEMNRMRSSSWRAASSVPRTRGDETATALFVSRALIRTARA